MKNRGGWSLTQGVLAACVALGLGACSVYDSTMLPQNGTNKPPAGKDAGQDSSTTPPDPDDGGQTDSGPDAADGCVPATEICNGKDDDCDDDVDETEAAIAYCMQQRPHATGVDCVNSTCLSDGCEAGYYDDDGRPQTACKKCGPGDCDDAGVDEDAGTL